MEAQEIGSYSFIAGALIAIVAAFVAVDATTASWITLLLVALGLVVGFLTIEEKETGSFLVAAIALLVASGAGLQNINTAFSGLGTILTTILSNIAVFVAPAAVVVALKTVYSFAKK